MATVDGGGDVRRRNVPTMSRKPTVDQQNEDNEKQEQFQEEQKLNLNPGSYWLTRILLLRALCFVYFVAFLVALHQNRALIGSKGLLPADKHLDSVRRHTRDSVSAMLQYAPTVLWGVDYTTRLDECIDRLAYVGLLLSGIVMVRGAANMVLMLIIWLLYHSIVNVGQRWYSFGWESQLLETGFLAAFLCPVLSMKAVPPSTPTPTVIIWGYRWLIFRIMIGAGMIKIRGDKCWRDLTCMNYHYETQPVPNPIAYYMHQEPEIMHKFETLTNHVVELGAPFLILLTRRCRLWGGTIQILFQLVLIVSGNLSFLNWLTIIPSLACFDDASVSWMFSGRRDSVRHQVWRVQAVQQEERIDKPRKLPWGGYLRRAFNLGIGGLIVYLSIPIVQNLLSSRQIMNTSFDPLRIVNTYGAFGSITKARTEVIFQGTYDPPSHPNAKWEEYEFKCKPGNVTRRPCLISPYHYRLDWLMWFAAFQSYQHNDWLVHLAAKFLANDEGVTDLIAHNPFQGRDPPKWVRAEHYKYVYTKIGSKAALKGHWWKRTRKENYLPPVSMETLKDTLTKMGWTVPRVTQKKYQKRS